MGRFDIRNNRLESSRERRDAEERERMKGDQAAPMLERPKPGLQLDEPVLADDYPVYAGYLYVADGRVLRSPMTGSVADLKDHVGASEIRRCDKIGREQAGMAPWLYGRDG
jgi:hypothetical protein